MPIDQKAVNRIYHLSRPLAVNTMDDAARVLAKEIEKGMGRDQSPEEWARHLAWIIGFDALLDDRASVQRIVEVVADV